MFLVIALASLLAPLLFSQEPVPTSLAWSIARAHAEGRTQIILPEQIPYMAEILDLDHAIAMSQIVVAERFDQATIHDAFGIYTCLKYKLVENLTPREFQATPRPGLLPESTPASLVPLQPDEFIVIRPFGTVKVDGVTISQVDRNEARLCDVPTTPYVFEFQRGRISHHSFL